MDPAYFHLWAAGYTLPPETLPKPADKPATPAPRRGKKAARAKRERVKA
jgi:hypothetical protein